jgi:hypothetical protein
VKQYTARPLTVEAQQFKGGIVDAGPILQWINTNGGKGVWCGAVRPNVKAEGRIQHPGLPESLRIRTNKGWETINIGDYIVRSEEGKFFPCSSETFNKTYESDLADVIDIQSLQSTDWIEQKVAPIA